MKRETILLSQCHKEYTQKFLQVRDIYNTLTQDQVTYNIMSKWACLVDLMTRLHNSVIAEERRKQNEDKGNNQNR